MLNVPNVPASPDLDEMRRALSILVAPERLFELRSLPSKSNWVGREIDAALAAVPRLAQGAGLYYTLNPLRSDMEGWAADLDVIERRWLLVDVDSERPNTDWCATETEKDCAARLAGRIHEFLAERGWPEPISVDSGNGYQLLYRIELPNNTLAYQWLGAVLHALEDTLRVPGAGAHIDTGVHNAARIARLPGSWNRKESPSPGRPHRLAQLLSVPDEIGIVSVGLIKALLDETRKETDPPVAEEEVEPTRNGHANGTPSSRPFPSSVPGVGPDRERIIASWFKRALDNEIAQAMLAPQGERHNTLRAAARTLAGYLQYRAFDEGELRQKLKVAGERSGLPEKEVRDVCEWAVQNGKGEPLAMPAKLLAILETAGSNGSAHANGTAQPPTEASGEETLGHSGRTYKFPLIIRGGTVAPKRIHWLWPERIPFGFLTLMAGRTGVGKSFVTLDAAARLTVGGEIPCCGGECFDPSGVLILSEDSHEYILAPRLLEAGADMDRINFMSWEAMAGFTLSDTQMLDDTYVAAGCPKLVVIDPPTNFLGSKDEHKNAEVRSVLMGISIWAMHHDIACALITHCNKGVKKDMAALDRIIGSVAWASTSRIAHVFAPDPDDRRRGVFVPLKSNIGEMPEGLSYQIEKTRTLARVKWIGPIEFDADAAMAGEKKPRAANAVEWLAARFRERREWPSEELKQLAHANGISKNALWSEEVKALPIKRDQVHENGSHHWVWRAMPGWPPIEGVNVPA